MADYYGVRYFGTINGAAAFVMTAGAVIGPWVVGRTVDATGTYTLGWAIAAAVAWLAVPVLLAARPPGAAAGGAAASAAGGAAPAAGGP